MILPFRRLFDLSGRSGRRELWAFTFLHLIIGIGLGILVSQGTLLPLMDARHVIIAGAVCGIILVWAWLALVIRRFHDLGYAAQQLVLWYTIIPIALTVASFFMFSNQLERAGQALMIVVTALNLYLLYLLYFKAGVNYRNSWGYPYGYDHKPSIGPSDDIYRPL